MRHRYIIMVHTMTKILPMRGCAHCLRAFRPTRVWQQYCGRSCRKQAGKDATKMEYVCTYCGLVADTIDHVPPTSIRPILIELKLNEQYPFMTVRSCRECNSTLGDRAYWTIEQRREYIASRLKRRYRKYLELPEWSQKELDALEYTLRQSVLHGLAVKALVLKRLERAQPDYPIPYVEVEPEELPTTPLTYCKTCDRPTHDDEFCSLICQYMVTGKRNGLSHGELWRGARRLFKKFPEKRRQWKIARLNYSIAALTDKVR